MGEEVEIGLAAYQAMWRYLRNEGEEGVGKYIAIPVALDVRRDYSRTGPAPTQAQIEELIERHDYGEPAASVGWIAYRVAGDLARHYPRHDQASASGPTQAATEAPDKAINPAQGSNGSGEAN